MSLYMLKSGEATHDLRLDRCRQVDIRSLSHPVRPLLLAEKLNVPRSYTWSTDVWLDQGQEGACVGFGFAHEAAARPVKVAMSNDFAREEVYWKAQQEDDWPGGSYPGAAPRYEGTSVLAGAKVCRRAGLFESYKWALDLSDLALYVGYKGPGVMGIDWYTGMFDVDADGFVSPVGRIEGGHCVCIVGVKIVWKLSKPTRVPGAWSDVDFVRSYFVFRNSWGRTWGVGGNARIRFVDMMKLWPGGDFCLPVGRQKAKGASV